MGYLNREAALKFSTELAKIMCANPSVSLYPEELSAQKIADFVKKLTDELSDTNVTQ